MLSGQPQFIHYVNINRPLLCALGSESGKVLGYWEVTVVTDSAAGLGPTSPEQTCQGAEKESQI